MKKLSGIICDICRRTITTIPTHEQSKEENHVCHNNSCIELNATIRNSELDKAKEYLNSDYYWQRKKELKYGQTS